jgi:predicted enzyme related to lactoylglutathione lyase
MKAAAFHLLVIRAANVQRLADFYSVLGLRFERHRHGQGPEHYSAQIGDSTFEIYPKQSEKDTTTSVRLGFAVPCVAEAIERLRAQSAQVISEPHESPWGRRAVIRDTEGHKVEIHERREVAT